MYANAYELRMPTNYVDMNANEMEYDGGWIWSAGLIVASLVCTAVSHATGDKNLKKLGTGLMVAGLVSTGVGACALATSAAVSTADAGVFILGMTSDALSISAFVAGY